MSRSVQFRVALAAVVVPMMLTVCASSARAQAFVPAQGEGAVSILFQDMYDKYHYLPTTAVDRGQINSEALLLDVTYGLTDKVAVSIGIPWVAAKYTGNFPHPLSDLTGVSPLDDGAYHGTLQDFRFNVRYNITKKGLALTPFIGSIVPSHDYTYFAHAAPGRDLNELQFGVSAAKLLDSLVPGLLVQASYSYGVTEQVFDISHNRSNLDLEIGYFVTPNLRLLALGTGQLTHGGTESSLTLPRDPILWPHHDQTDRINSLNLGGGTAYSVTDKVDIFASLIHTVAQRNGHAVDLGLTMGLSWSFTTARAKNRAIASAENSLVKCLCGKGTK